MQVEENYKNTDAFVNTYMYNTKTLWYEEYGITIRTVSDTDVALPYITE